MKFSKHFLRLQMSMFYSLSQCLSSCIYESLCDIENLPVPKGARYQIASYIFVFG